MSRFNPSWEPYTSHETHNDYYHRIPYLRDTLENPQQHTTTSHYYQKRHTHYHPSSSYTTSHNLDSYHSSHHLESYHQAKPNYYSHGHHTTAYHDDQQPIYGSHHPYHEYPNNNDFEIIDTPPKEIIVPPLDEDFHPFSLENPPPTRSRPPLLPLVTGPSSRMMSSNSNNNSDRKTENVILDVGPRDVLCGRGAPSNWNPGNHYFRRLVDSAKKEYLQAKRCDKHLIATRIIELIRSEGGRFLKRSKIHGVNAQGRFTWVEIGYQQSYEKACQSLREGAPELRRRLKKDADENRMCCYPKTSVVNKQHHDEQHEITSNVVSPIKTIKRSNTVDVFDEF